MKFSKSASLAALIAASLACGVALAEPVKLADKIKPISPPAATGAGPLKGVIHVTPNALKHVSFQEVVLLPNQNSIDKKYKLFTPDAVAYEQGVKKMPDFIKSCANKAYTVQDQTAAGCTASETMSQCMEKLHKHCLMTQTNTPMYKQAAKMAASEARNLSQILTQYANQAEQNANSW